MMDVAGTHRGPVLSVPWATAHAQHRSLGWCGVSRPQSIWVHRRSLSQRGRARVCHLR